MAFTALHIGDLHFWRIPLNPLQYMGKRLLGNANLILRRSRVFHKHLAGDLVARACDLRPDFVFLSGDFTTTASDHEFRQAADALRPLLDILPGRVFAVPGNHDRYTRRSIHRLAFEQHLGALRPGVAWPYFVELEPDFWLVGIDGGTSNGLRPFGRLKPSDMEAIRTWWEGLAAKPARLAVLCHFPAEDPPGALPHDRGPQFLDSRPLLDFLAESGASTLYLHGHHHYRWLYASPTVPGLTYLNAGAPLLCRTGPRPDMGFLELRSSEAGVAFALHHHDVAGREWRREEAVLPVPGGFLNLQDR